MPRPTARRAPALAVLAVALAALGLLAGGGGTSGAGEPKLKVRDEPKLALPSTKDGCGGAVTRDGVTTIPIKVDRFPNLADALVNICIDGKGPYPLTIDTGASRTTISTEIAEELGLKAIGKPVVIHGAGCDGSAQKFRLPDWSIGGVRLEGGVIQTIEAPEQGPGFPRGSLGADVLARFGAVRLDFNRQELVVVGKEGRPFKRTHAPRALPRSLVRSIPQINAPMEVEAAAGSVKPFAEVTLGGTKPQRWLVDTGSDTSAVDPGLVKAAKLKSTGEARRSPTFCSTVDLHEYSSGSWTLAGEALKPQRVGAIPLIDSVGVAGLLGAYPLVKYGSVVFDFAGGQLLLGAG
jgi:predicted aspartyl protease